VEPEAPLVAPLAANPIRSVPAMPQLLQLQASLPMPTPSLRQLSLLLALFLKESKVRP
jgi:hypothetical protein